METVWKQKKNGWKTKRNQIFLTKVTLQQKFQAKSQRIWRLENRNESYKLSCSHPMPKQPTVKQGKRK